MVGQPFIYHLKKAMLTWFIYWWRLMQISTSRLKYCHLQNFNPCYKFIAQFLQESFLICPLKSLSTILLTSFLPALPLHQLPSFFSHCFLSHSCVLSFLFFFLSYVYPVVLWHYSFIPSLPKSSSSFGIKYFLLYVQDGCTALYLASQKNCLLVVNLLLKCKVNIELCKQVCCLTLR